MNPFGLYQMEMLGFEGIMLMYVTFRTYAYLKHVQMTRQDLKVAPLVLYSNPLTTGILCGLSLFWVILMTFGYQAILSNKVLYY
jgi:hypothetical protein